MAPLSSEPLVRSYDSLEAAVAALRALLEAGIPAEALELRVIEDEAGPVEGNFLIGNGPDVSYKEDFARTVARGVHLLMVHVHQPDQREFAAGVVDRFDGVDPAAASASASAP